MTDTYGPEDHAFDAEQQGRCPLCGRQPSECGHHDTEPEADQPHVRAFADFADWARGEQLPDADGVVIGGMADVGFGTVTHAEVYGLGPDGKRQTYAFVDFTNTDLAVEPCGCWEYNTAASGPSRMACETCAGTDREGADWPPGMTLTEALIMRMDRDRRYTPGHGYDVPVWGELHNSKGETVFGVVGWTPEPVVDDNPGHRIELDERGRP